MKEDIEPRNAKGQPHGYWKIYYSNDKLYYKCVYINGKENGLEEYYWRDKDKLRCKNYYL